MHRTNEMCGAAKHLHEGFEGMSVPQGFQQQSSRAESSRVPEPWLCTAQPKLCRFLTYAPKWSMPGVLEATDSRYLRFHTRRLGAAKPHLNQGRLGRALTHEQACQGQHCQPITRRRSACSLISLLLSGGHAVLMQTHCAQNCSAMNHPAILSPVHRSSWQLQCLWAQLQ